jgi:hypothetical protein
MKEKRVTPWRAGKTWTLSSSEVKLKNNRDLYVLWVKSSQFLTSMLLSGNLRMLSTLSRILYL